MESEGELMDRAAHWEGVHKEKGEREVSWFEEEPTVSLELIERCAKEILRARGASRGQQSESEIHDDAREARVGDASGGGSAQRVEGVGGDGGGSRSEAELKGVRVIDVGGGSSILARRLVERGCEVMVVDIARSAIERGKARCGEMSSRVRWMVGDVTKVEELPGCDVWHDRAAFHFLTSERERDCYIQSAERTVVGGGYLVVGTFADDGPERCSGLVVERYGEEKLRAVFAEGFEAVEMRRVRHVTPWGKEQRFLWGVFLRGS